MSSSLLADFVLLLNCKSQNSEEALNLDTDGEKPNRNRDSEFIDTFKSRAEIIEYWDKGCYRKSGSSHS